MELVISLLFERRERNTKASSLFLYHQKRRLSPTHSQLKCLPNMPPKTYAGSNRTSTWCPNPICINTIYIPRGLVITDRKPSLIHSSCTKLAPPFPVLQQTKKQIAQLTSRSQRSSTTKLLIQPLDNLREIIIRIVGTIIIISIVCSCAGVAHRRLFCG